MCVDHANQDEPSCKSGVAKTAEIVETQMDYLCTTAEIDGMVSDGEGLDEEDYSGL